MSVTSWIRAAVEAGLTAVVIFALFKVFFPRVLRLLERQMADAREERAQHRTEIERLSRNLNFLAHATQEQTHEIHELRRDIRDSLSDDLPREGAAIVPKPRRPSSTFQIPDTTEDIRKK